MLLSSCIVLCWHFSTVPFRFYTSERQRFTGEAMSVTTATTAGICSGYFGLNCSLSLLFVLSGGYSGWLGVVIRGSRCRMAGWARRCLLFPQVFPSASRLYTHTHTHGPSAQHSYVSNAVNQQASGPVAIPPDCWTQLAYLRTVCVRWIKICMSASHVCQHKVGILEHTVSLFSSRFFSKPVG